MRLIDADDIAYESIDSSDTTRYEDYYGTGIFAVRKEDIDAMPTIEPERKKGEWERKSFYDDTPICSECGIEGRWDFEYCPYCGADMKGEKYETD